MKALKIIGFSLLGLIAVVAILSFVIPTKMHFERSIVINAPKEAVFAQIKSLKAHEKWSPWLAKDPNAKVTYEGTDGMVGSMNTWDGNKEVGKGTETISLLEEGKRYESKLHFIEPWESDAAAYITLIDTMGGVKVSWGFNGDMSRPFNVMTLFMNMDKQMGSDLDIGLGKLKTLCESMPPAVTGAKTY